MLHPLFSTVIQRPDLVVDHISAYAALLNQEVKATGTGFVELIVAWLMVVFCGFLFLSLAGIALMLGFIHNQFHWALVAVPGIALILAVFAFSRTRQAPVQEHFHELKAQLDSDLQALRAAA